MEKSSCNCDCNNIVFRLNKVSSCPVCFGSSAQPQVPNNFTTDGETQQQRRLWLRF